MSRFGIFGTSGFAREVGDIALELGYEPLYVARDKAELTAWQFPWDAILESEVERYRDIGFAIGIGENLVRQKVAQRYSGRLRFANLIHPSATFGYGQRGAIEISHGNIICAGARLTCNIQVGDFCIFNLNATIGHDVIVDGFVNLAPGAHISGNVHIGSRCWVGTGAVVNQGKNEVKLHIGSDTLIGSGAVVLKDCEANAVYVGTPARRIR